MTFSILARDPATGALGAAVASKFFAVGALVIHVEGGVGACATQAMVNPLYGPQAMARLRAGEAPEAIVAALTGPDPGRDQRQLHVLDARGRIGQHTGNGTVSWAGQVRGTDVSVAGNMLAGPAVVDAMLNGFERSAGDMVTRLLAAMQAGEDAGGDKRGKQSAALQVCLADSYPNLDIRADDHPDPLGELRRLHRISLERYAVFRRFLAGRDNPWGSFDRAAIEAAVQRDGVPLPTG